jgi:DNA-binding Xre family transcriptional regulator
MRAGKRKTVIRLRLHVREIAERQGISRTKLSRLADVNYATINGLWEDEASEKGIMLVTLIKVAKVLKVNVDDLYDVIEEE